MKHKKILLVEDDYLDVISVKRALAKLNVDPTLYVAARIDGASQWQIVLRIKIPLVAPALVLILVFALIGTLQFFNEPKILQDLAAGAIPNDFTPNMYAYQQAFSLANYNYGATISFHGLFGERRVDQRGHPLQSVRHIRQPRVPCGLAGKTTRREREQ